MHPSEKELLLHLLRYIVDNFRILGPFHQSLKVLYMSQSLTRSALSKCKQTLKLVTQI